MTNLPPARPTSSSFPPPDNTNRPSPTVFASPTSSYTTDNDGITSGDLSSSSIGSSTFSSDDNPTRPDDLYNIQNKFPTTSNRIPQQPSGNREPDVMPSTPLPPPPNNQQQHHHQKPHINRPPHTFEPDRPDVHHPYPLGPDPFPDYFPQPHPHYHFQLDHHFDDKNSPHFPGIYAPNAPSQHNSDRYYPHPMEQFGLYPSSRYPESGMNLANYNPNRKNGYQVNENVPDIPKGKGEWRMCVNNRRRNNRKCIELMSISEAHRFNFRGLMSTTSSII